MYFLIFGADTFRSREHLNAMVAHFKKTRDMSGFNVARLNFETAEVGDVRAVLRTPPFLSDKKLVILENFFGAKKSETEELKSEVESSADFVNIVFFESKSREDLADSVLFETLVGQKFTQEFKTLNLAEAKDFALKVFAKFGVDSKNIDINLLAKNYYANTWQLYHETIKLIALVAWGGEIQIDKLEAVGTVDPIFQFTDNYILNNKKETLRLLNETRENSPDYLILQTTLKSLTTTVAVISFAQDNFTDQNIIAKDLGMHPYPVKKIFGLKNRLSVADLQVKHQTLFNILKTNMFQPVIPEIDFSVWNKI